MEFETECSLSMLPETASLVVIDVAVVSLLLLLCQFYYFDDTLNPLCNVTFWNLNLPPTFFHALFFSNISKTVVDRL